MEKYMLLFRNGLPSEEDFQNLSPEAMQTELAKWETWISGIAAKGKMVSTDALQNSGKLVSGSKHIITDGPFIESKELVSGYLVLKADNIEEAMEHAKGCPIFEIEGTVEVRPVMEF
jgi:hypothetical protein